MVGFSTESLSLINLKALSKKGFKAVYLPISYYKAKNIDFTNEALKTHIRLLSKMGWSIFMVDPECDYNYLRTAYPNLEILVNYNNKIDSFLIFFLKYLFMRSSKKVFWVKIKQKEIKYYIKFLEKLV